ncbi:hypothetical protein TNCV_4369531 [Trichonephila clavipes]|nr:hypothetical protein TNCV_4369531 [Trichonephila clavipes]
MASLRKRFTRDHKKNHFKALDLANKVAGLISKMHYLKWDIPNLDEDNLTDFLSNDGLHVWQYISAFIFTWRENMEYSPKFWVMTEENFANRVHAMMQETGNPQGHFEKEHLFVIYAHISVIASWFIEHNTENMMERVIEVVYHINLKIFNSTPIYSSSW